MGLLGKVTKSLFGGSESKQRSNMDPRLMDAFLSNWRRAGDAADDLGRRTVLPAGETFGAGVGAVRGGIESAAAPLERAATAAGDAIGRAPSTVTAGQFGGEGFGRYLNPATDAVVDRTLGDLDRQRQIVQQGNEDAAIRAKAFGGSRQGVVEAETNRGFADTAARTAAGLRSQAFDKAAGLQAGDHDRSLAAERANQLAGLDASRVDLAGAGLLGDIADTTRRGGMESGVALANLGLTEREFSQEQLDADRLLELERQRIRNEALGIAPAGGAGKVSTGKSSTSPGFLGGVGDFFGNFYKG